MDLFLVPTVSLREQLLIALFGGPTALQGLMMKDRTPVRTKDTCDTAPSVNHTVRQRTAGFLAMSAPDSASSR
jgi:hypothetical protein